MEPKNSNLFPGQEQPSDRYEEPKHTTLQTLDEYIEQLQRLREEFGGQLSVEKWVPSKGRHSAPKPVVAFAKVVQFQARDGSKASVKVPQFWDGRWDEVKDRGERVVRV